MKLNKYRTPLKLDYVKNDLIHEEYNYYSVVAYSEKQARDILEKWLIDKKLYTPELFDEINFKIVEVEEDLHYRKVKEKYQNYFRYLNFLYYCEMVADLL